MLRAEALVGRGTARPDDGHGHLELPARGGVRVPGAGELRHAVDAEVGIHELDDGAVAVHRLAERLADEVPLVNDLVRRAQRAERLLRVRGDVVRGARLQVLGVRHARGVAHHLLQNREVHRVADGDAFRVRRHRAERVDAPLERGQRLRGHSRRGHLRRLLQAHLGLALRVINRAGEVGVLELGGERGGGGRAGVGKLQRAAHLLLGAGGAPLDVHARGVRGLLEDLDRVARRARPALLVLAVALVLGVRGRVPVEAERVHLQNSRPLRPHVVDRGAADPQRVLHVLAVRQHAGDAVVLPLVEHLLVLRDVLGERVDRAAVVDDEEQNRQVFLRRRVEALRHAPVLRAALADEHDRDAILGFARVEVLVEHDGARGADRVRELLRDERPAALEVRLHVVHVHGSAGAATGAAVAAEELRHHRTRVDAARQRVAVVAVVRVLEISLANSIAEQRGNRLLAVVEVHEPPDLPRHVRLVALILEIAAQLHRLVRAVQVLIGELARGGDLRLGHAELLLERDLRVLPGGGDAHALEVRGRLDRAGTHGGAPRGRAPGGAPSGDGRAARERDGGGHGGGHSRVRACACA